MVDHEIKRAKGRKRKMWKSVGEIKEKTMKSIFFFKKKNSTTH